MRGAAVPCGVLSGLPSLSPGPAVSGWLAPSPGPVGTSLFSCHAVSVRAALLRRSVLTMPQMTLHNFRLPSPARDPVPDVEEAAEEPGGKPVIVKEEEALEATPLEDVTFRFVGEGPRHVGAGVASSSIGTYAPEHFVSFKC